MSDDTDREFRSEGAPRLAEHERSSEDRTPARRRRLPRPPRGTVGTIIKLALACFLVGVVLTLLNIDPVAFWRGTWRAITESARDLYDFGLGGVGLVLAIMATGAIVVLPIWAVKRLLGRLRRR